MFAKSEANTPINTLTDESLIAQYQSSGNTQYIDELYHRYVHLVYGTCLKHLKDKDESKDVTMVVFGKLVEKLRKENVQSFNHWLYSLSCNECKEYLRKRQRVAKANAYWTAEQEQELRIDMVEEEEVSTLQEEQAAERVQAAIRQLGRQQQECVRLFFFENKSYKEIARLTSYSVAEVKSYLQNGKRKLKRLLADFE
ncbi:MAG: sigma-70 family RNA polymerase sigma factor [Bacteroidota bacterium]